MGGDPVCASEVLSSEAVGVGNVGALDVHHPQCLVRQLIVLPVAPCAVVEHLPQRRAGAAGPFWLGISCAFSQTGSWAQRLQEFPQPPCEEVPRD